MRQTSADALAEIKESLSGERLRAYETLYQSGPMTGSELNVALQTKNAHKRLSELVKRGVVAEVGFKNCSRTGKRALLWDVTTNLPRHVVRPAGVPTPSNEDVQHFLGRIGKRDRDLMTCEDCEGDGYTFAKKDGGEGLSRLEKLTCQSCGGTAKSKRSERVTRWLRARFPAES